MSIIEQGTAAWRDLRLGQVSSSRVAEIVARTKSGYSASRANYMAQLLCERLTGTVADGFTSPTMQWGIDHEAEARSAYEFRFDATVELASYVSHPTIEMSGASPDGLVGTDGLLEIKCPNTATHLETLLTGTIPSKYEAQMFWQLACTGRVWCDFVSFDPRLPEALALYVKRVQRDDERIAELEAEVRYFLRELDTTIGQLDAAYLHREVRV